MSKTTLLVIDLQNDYFTGGKLPLVGIDQATANAARILAAARAKNDRVIHIQHENPRPDPAFFAPGSEGMRIHPAVAPQGNEPVIVKNYPNAFLNTDLKDHLDEAGVEEITLVGAMSHMCIEAAARTASDFGYRVTVVHDACATRDLNFGEKTIPAAQVHGAAMAALEFGYATLLSTEQYLTR